MSMRWNNNNNDDGNNSSKKSTRRGLSTVVGGMFMVIIMAGALNVTLWAIQQQDRVTAAVAEKTNGDVSRLNEKIEISGLRIEGNGRLNVTVTNTGGQPARLASIYIVNETASPKQQFRYDLGDVAVDGRGAVAGIGQSIPFTAKGDSLYSVKVVTKSGNSAASNIAPVSSLALPMSLYVIPPTVTPGENVTLLYTVSNNSTDSYLAGGVTPIISYSMGCSPPNPGCQLTQYAAPAGNAKIARGATGMFKWVYKVDAPDNTPITFNATLAGARQGNYVVEKAFAKLVSASQTSFYSDSANSIVYSALAQKPELFLTIPSPFGEDSGAGKGLWGVVVVNPTSAPIQVSRVILSASPVITDRTERIIDNNGTPCPNTPVTPSTASEWSCPEENMIQWKDVANPEVVPAKGTLAFFARYQPGSLGGGGDDPAFMVSATVFTSYGQFTKAGYSTGMRNGDEAIGNVYLTDTTVESTALQTAHIFGQISSVQSGSQFTMHVAMAELGKNTAGIKAGSKLIVNIPKGFTITSQDILSWSGFNNNPTLTTYSDGSSQIAATLTSNLGTSGSSEEVKVLKFQVRAPIVTDKKVYVFFTLASGETTSASAMSVGAVGEFPVQITP